MHDDFDGLRAIKMERVTPLLREDMQHIWRDGRVDYLTDALRAETKIIDTENVSAFGYDPDMEALIAKHRDGLVLDCGAGSKADYRPNVVCMEIVEYPSTDVLGVGEHLPFKDNSFDAVLSVAVLEHVRDPFRCASEIVRVLKPGGDVMCVMPFLQPLHGFPHHYFNATHQGLARLFEDQVTDMKVVTPLAGHPIFTLSWMIESWANGLAADVRQTFLDMRVGDLIGPAALSLQQPYCSELPPEKRTELACGNTLTARKA